MRIGIICEGPSDYPAITHFFGDALQADGIQTESIPLFPQMDRTRPEGGWGNVLLWLRRNPPQSRIQRYFGGGLFGGGLSTEPLDAILMQLDADAISEKSFKVFVKQNYNFQVDDADDPAARGSQITQVLSLAADFDQMTAADVARHVPVPAVEASETWCVAAFNAKRQDYEVLRGVDLANAFMAALEKSEGRNPQANYMNVDKNLARRKNFCVKHASGSNRVIAGCAHFAAACVSLAALA